LALVREVEGGDDRSVVGLGVPAVHGERRELIVQDLVRDPAQLPCAGSLAAVG
jgi:hypothetical protein